MLDANQLQPNTPFVIIAEILPQWPARFKVWLFITAGQEQDQNGSYWGMKVSSYSSGEEAGVIVEINHLSW